MLEDLVKAKIISPEDRDLYLTYKTSEAGNRHLMTWMHAVFMEEPARDIFTATGHAWYDGRRSIFRDIAKKIEIIENHLKGVKNEQ